jgi:hypothetical protein
MPTFEGLIGLCTDLGNGRWYFEVVSHFHERMAVECAFLETFDCLIRTVG